MSVEPGERVLRARLTNMLDQSFTFGACLTAVTSGGFTTLVERAVASRPGGAGPFWAEVQVPGRGAPLEYVVRPVQCDLPAGSGQAIVQWSLCAGDGPTTHRKDTAALQQFLSGEQADVGAAADAPSAYRR